MAVKILSGVLEVLKKVVPTPPATPPPAPPDLSRVALEALWALPARPNETLFLINRKNGNSYQVIEYSPGSSRLVLRNLTYNLTFETKFTEKESLNYDPVWR